MKKVATLDRAMRVSYLNEEDKQRFKNRLARIQGQVEGIAQMIANGVCADEILIQIAAAKSALNATALALVEEHLTACSTRCMRGTLEQVVQRLSKALAVILRGG